VFKSAYRPPAGRVVCLWWSPCDEKCIHMSKSNNRR
jgi:hypothetical protein